MFVLNKDAHITFDSVQCDDARYCHRSFVRLSVTLVDHSKTVSDIEIRFAPYDTLMSGDGPRQISWSLV